MEVEILRKFILEILKLSLRFVVIILEHVIDLLFGFVFENLLFDFFS